MKENLNILDIELGTQQSSSKKLEVVDVSIENVKFKDGSSGNKAVVMCRTEDGKKEFKISEAWAENRGKKETQGLWVNLDNEGKIAKNSTLGKLLEHHNVQKLGDLVGTKVLVYPDQNNYLVFTTCSLP